MRRQAPNVWVSQRHSDTLSQDMRALVGKCPALSPTLLSTGSAHSNMDDASYDASFSFLCAKIGFIQIPLHHVPRDTLVTVFSNFRKCSRQVLIRWIYLIYTSIMIRDVLLKLFQKIESGIVASDQ